MKKLLNGKFLFITASCLVVLVGIILGSFYLFDNSDSKFIKSGYIINPLSEASEKYFFNKDTGYHKNLSSMIEFNDVDNRDVAVLYDSFLHYNDESLSFLKNGAILDLDSINGNDAVKFYNITSSSIIENDNNKYLIKSKNGDININNFIGRINENKYIVVGDLQLKVNGNTNAIPGNYFEIVYVEDGVVNIENKDVKYQVMADGSSILVGNKIEIDLGDKKIMSSGKDVMSITSITIDGNENIEIIPEEIVQEPEPEGNGDGNGGEGNGTGNNPGEDGQGGTGNDKVNNDNKTEEIIISLKDALIGSTNVNVTFDIMNAKEDDNFTLQVVNLSSGRTVDINTTVKVLEEIKVNLLTPNTKYLFTVINEKDGNKYFQKIFETSGFGIKLDKIYSSSSSIAYRVSIDEDTDVTNATLTLYKYNEETKQNEVVKTSYQDSTTGEIIETPKITHLSSLDGGIGVQEIIYDGLDSDTIYTAVLDEFSIASSNFKDIYNITLTSMTLKKVPEFNKMNISQDAGKGIFELSLGDVIDPDGAITKYTYVIYDKLTDAMAIDPIEKNNASPISVKIGSGENMLSNDTNYYYKVIIEYFDNEKYIEYVTSDSITFMMGSDPFITVEADQSKISYDSIGGTIYLTDNSCLVTMPGREKCDGASNTVLVVSKINPLTGDLTTVYSKPVDFVVNTEEDTVKYDFSINGLEEGTAYNIDVKTILNNNTQNERVSIVHTEESNRQISTKTLTSFYVSWDTENYSSDATHVVNVGSKFNVDTEKNVGTLSPEESMNSIKKVTVELYEGNQVDNMNIALPVKRVTYTRDDLDIKKSFYDEIFQITSDETFGYSIDGLKALNTEGKLNSFYTLVINAYYDSEGNNKVKLSNNIIPYKINRFLLLDNIDEPVLEIEAITNKASGFLFPELKNGGTIVGYKLSCGFDRAGMLLNSMEPQNINLYVYDSKTNRRVNFYYVDKETGKLVRDNHITSSLGENNFYEDIIYMDYGIDYYSSSNMMTRGNKYKVGFEVEVISGGQTEVYPQVGPGKFNNYKGVDSQKESPNVKMYIAKSTENSIKYNYEITDPDNSIYKDEEDEAYSFYYVVGENEEEIVENKLPLVEVTNNDIKMFSGSMTIDGLSNGDKYLLYYKKNIQKTGKLEKDVLPYINDEDDGGRIFDGYYNALAVDGTGNSLYNFRFEIINDQLKDNNVIVKILADEKILSRIVSYKITFTDSENHTLEKELWQLKPCNQDDTVNRCLSVDYVELKNAGMKSTQERENLITVEVNAYYDNGLTGYEYKVGTDEDADYQYMIMQNNSSLNGLGGYVSFNKAGTPAIWNNDLLVSKGYYTYTINGQRITYKSKFNTSNSASIPFNISSVGYLSNYGILNPKMISVDKMYSFKNTFSFSSITPKVAPTVKTRLLDGAVINLQLYGLDISDMVSENGKYYLYLETWSDEEEVGDTDDKVKRRPTVKAEIDKNDITKPAVAVVDGLDVGTIYSYNVYARMRKNNTEAIVQLFDAGYTDRYEAKTYKFSSLGTGDVFTGISANYTTTEVYGNRQLNIKFSMAAYANSYPYNFDLVYAFCHMNDSNCGINPGNTSIFSNTIAAKDIINGMVETIDITDFDLEFGKDYRIMIFARLDYYNKAPARAATIINDFPVRLNTFGNNRLNLKALTTPTFVITKNAFSYTKPNGSIGYGIDFKVNLSDPDRTVINGVYRVKLLDESNNAVGTMQLNNDGNSYYTVNNYVNYEFDALVSNKSIRFTDLNPDTKYTLVAYAPAYLNNYSSASETETQRYNRKHPEISESKTAYTVDDYGVAFGRDITYSATAKSVVVTFLGGSSFDNVKKVRYTIGLWDSNESSSTTSSGVFDLVSSNKKFELFTATDDWKFVIDPTDMKNVLGQTYTVNVSFEVKNGSVTKWLTSEYNSKFEGTVQYVEDK